MDVSISGDPFAPDVIPATHMLAGAQRDPKPSAEPSAEASAVDAPVDAPAATPEPEDAFEFASGGIISDPTPPQESAGPTDTPTQEESDELPEA